MKSRGSYQRKDSKKHSILLVSDSNTTMKFVEKELDPKKVEFHYLFEHKKWFNYFKNKSIDIIIFDTTSKLKKQPEMELFHEIRSYFPNAEMLITTDNNKTELMVDLVKLGVTDFFFLQSEDPKGLFKQKINGIIQNLTALKIGVIAEKIDTSVPNFFHSKAMQTLKKTVKISVKNKSRFVIEGEFGTGRRTFAKHIHEEYIKNGSKYKINKERTCFLQLDNNNFKSFDLTFKDYQKYALLTVYFHDVHNFDFITKEKLKIVLKDHLEQSKKMKIIISFDVTQPTNDPSFLETLQYNFNCIRLKMPLLQNRLEDIPHFVTYFMKKNAKKHSLEPLNWSKKTINLFTEYNWTGNISELQNTVEKLLILGYESHKDVKALLDADVSKIGFLLHNLFEMNDLKIARDAFEKQYILHYLKKMQYNITKTAEVLNIDRTSLHRKINELNVKY